MDKVKQLLTLLKKYHFWMLCVVAALVGLLVWNSAVGKLATEFKKDSANIEQTLTSLTQIKSPHPNDTWTEGLGKLTDSLRDAVKAAWEDLYKQQKQEVYIWPQTLGKEFLAAVAAVESNPEETFSDKLRERYQNMIRHEAARLAQIVDAPVVEEGAVAGEPRMIAEDAETARHRIKWAQLAEIQSSFDWDQPPSTQMILYMQEELWVYEALCKVIQAVNEGSKGAFDAPITEIGEMAIAYTAVEDQPGGGGKRIWRRKGVVGTDTSAAPPAGEGAKQKPDPRSRGKQEEKPGGGEENADPDSAWKSFRYVKETGEPLMGGDLATASPEYNLMPFRMQLSIDPRDLDRLLVTFRNSVLPIEVRQVRINPGMGVIATTFSGGGAQRSSDSAAGETAHKMDRVEISGVVYLIKPFNPQALGIAPAPESGGGEPAEGATPPAGQPPAAGAPAVAAPAAGEAPAGGAPAGQPPAAEAPAGGAPGG